MPAEPQAYAREEHHIKADPIQGTYNISLDNRADLRMQ